MSTSEYSPYTVINLPLATVDGQTSTYKSLSSEEINTIISDLPLVINTDTEANTYSRTGAIKGKVYTLADFKEDKNANYGPWVDVDSSGNEYLNYYYKIENYTQDGNLNNGTPSYSFTIDNTNKKLIITTNFLPSHNTGKYPMPRSSPCYKYDPNQGTTVAQNVVMTLPLNPVYSNNPLATKMSIQGYCFDNAAFYMALDGDGHDAVSFRCLDDFWGHPQSEGIYHHHTTPFALINSTIDTKIRVVGYALDGFPIVAPFLVERDNGTFTPLSTDDLDECHGLKKNISFVFQNQTLSYSYFYVTSLDFPYWISAFRGSELGVYTNN
jgi:hypothetical protein